MELSRIEFQGLKYFKDGVLRIPILGNRLTSFVGPNSSGKTTILRIINSILLFLANNAFSEKLKESDEWYDWKSALITFSVDRDGDGGEKLMFFEDGPSDFITLTVSRNNKELFLSKIETDYKSIELKDLKKPYLINPQTEVLKNKILERQKSMVQFKDDPNDIRMRLMNPQQIQENKESKAKKITEINEEIKNIQKDVDESKVELLDFVDSKTHTVVEVSKTDLKESLLRLGMPTSKFIEAGTTPSASIEKMLTEVVNSKKSLNTQKYEKVKKELSVLLGGVADFEETQDLKRNFYLDHAKLEQLSHGTLICLFYYSLIYETDPNTIILWDEPENGLHATRRFKLLNLFLNDSRQYFLGTHATEFTPVLNSESEIYQTESSSPRSNEKLLISIRHCTDRREAFRVAEKLGVYPSTTLFTSNVVIWVEGPSELFFWRKWIGDGAIRYSLVEGFDYTFLMYGGSNISHQEIEDDPGLVVGFDLLSVSRYPLVISDSDFAVEPTNPPPFKKGVQNIKESIDKINNQNSDSALFKYTSGRELENYFPAKAIRHAILELGKYSDQEIQTMQSATFEVGKYEHYYESINLQFVTNGLVGGPNKAKNYSLWGENRKVDFVKAALKCPGLVSEDMNYDFKIHLTEIVDWIKNRRVN